MAVNPDTLWALQHENASLKDENRALRGELIRLRNAIRTLKDLQNSLESISPQTDVNALIKKVLAWALDAVGSADGSLMLLDEERNELVFVEAQGAHRDVLIGYRLPEGVGIASWVVANRRPELVSDVRLEPRFSRIVDEFIGFRTHTLICAPLIHEDRVLGAIEVVNTASGEPFHEEALDIMILVANLASQALARAEGDV